jgi:hypothetical protein
MKPWPWGFFESSGSAIAEGAMIVQQGQLLPRIPVTDDLDRQVREALKRRRGSSRTLLYVCILAAISGTSGYVWLNYDSLVKLAFAERSSAAPEVDGSDTGVTQKDFEALKRQMAESTRSTIEDMDAQKADLKKLSDQVTALAAKIDALQSSTRATGSLSAPSDIRAGSQPAVPARVPLIAAKKKPHAPNRTGGISVGGAPLPSDR